MPSTATGREARLSVKVRRAHHANDLSGQVILVVEGDPTVAFQLRSNLEPALAQVVLACDVAEAWRCLASFPISAAVIDYRRGQDGRLELATDLRARGITVLLIARDPLPSHFDAPIITGPVPASEVVQRLKAMLGG